MIPKNNEIGKCVVTSTDCVSYTGTYPDCFDRCLNRDLSSVLGNIMFQLCELTHDVDITGLNPLCLTNLNSGFKLKDVLQEIINYLCSLNSGSGEFSCDQLSSCDVTISFPCLGGRGSAPVILPGVGPFTLPLYGPGSVFDFISNILCSANDQFSTINSILSSINDQINYILTNCCNDPGSVFPASFESIPLCFDPRVPDNYIGGIESQTINSFYDYHGYYIYDIYNQLCCLSTYIKSDGLRKSCADFIYDGPIANNTSSVTCHSLYAGYSTFNLFTGCDTPACPTSGNVLLNILSFINGGINNIKIRDVRDVVVHISNVVDIQNKINDVIYGTLDRITYTLNTYVCDLLNSCIKSALVPDPEIVVYQKEGFYSQLNPYAAAEVSPSPDVSNALYVRLLEDYSTLPSGISVSGNPNVTFNLISYVFDGTSPSYSSSSVSYNTYGISAWFNGLILNGALDETSLYSSVSYLTSQQLYIEAECVVTLRCVGVSGSISYVFKRYRLSIPSRYHYCGGVDRLYFKL